MNTFYLFLKVTYRLGPGRDRGEHFQVNNSLPSDNLFLHASELSDIEDQLFYHLIFNSQELHTWQSVRNYWTFWFVRNVKAKYILMIQMTG